MYPKASGLGLQVGADPAADGSIVSGLLNDESFLSRKRVIASRNSGSLYQSVRRYKERFRRRALRALQSGSPGSDHRVAGLASEQQCDQHPDKQ